MGLDIYYIGHVDKTLQWKVNDSKYDKDYMKIKFNTDDDILLNKNVNIMTITVVISCIFEKDGKYYPKCF